MKSIIAVALTLFSAVPSWALTIDTVPVADVGNASDSATGNLYGGVNYAYNIGKYEVTVGQYVTFLNAVAATDAYGLYDSRMTTDPNSAGIARSGVSGSYAYSAIGSPDHPVTYVNWGDAARFCNWLNNGQPVGPQNTSTTEDGAYTLNGAVTDAALRIINRNSNKNWYIPTESEWYKAAYYQPVSKGGDTDSYWAYPMHTNSVPFSDQPPGVTPDNTRVGNFKKNDGIANGYDDGFAVTGTINYGLLNYLTDEGAYALSTSYYGTFDQGDDVAEWLDGLIAGLGRPLRGGSWDGEAAFMSAGESGTYANPSDAYNEIGFRLVNISTPEPSTIFLLFVSLAYLPAIRRRPTSHNRA